MAQRRRIPQNKRQIARLAPQTRTLHRPPEIVERQAPIVYGKPFMLLEDEAKNTFIFQSGEWVPHSATIAECRQTCQVKQLPQRVNGRTRYEIRSPLSA